MQYNISSAVCFTVVDIRVLFRALNNEVRDIADVLMLDEHVDVIRSGKTGLAGAMDGLKSVAIGEATEKSWREYCMFEVEVDLMQ